MAHEHSLEKRIAETERIENDVKGLKKYLEDNGLEVKEVGGGSTGTVEQKPKDTVYTDIQAGSYIFMDTAYDQLKLGFDNSLFVLTTVISTKKDRVVTDTGVKSLGMDPVSYTHLDVYKRQGFSLRWYENIFTGHTDFLTGFINSIKIAVDVYKRQPHTRYNCF